MIQVTIKITLDKDTMAGCEADHAPHIDHAIRAAIGNGMLPGHDSELLLDYDLLVTSSDDSEIRELERAADCWDCDDTGCSSCQGYERQYQQINHS